MQNLLHSCNDVEGTVASFSVLVGVCEQTLVRRHSRSSWIKHATDLSQKPGGPCDGAEGAEGVGAGVLSVPKDSRCSTTADTCLVRALANVRLSSSSKLRASAAHHVSQARLAIAVLTDGEAGWEEEQKEQEQEQEEKWQRFGGDVEGLREGGGGAKEDLFVNYNEAAADPGGEGAGEREGGRAEARIEFVTLHDGFVVWPYGFRIFNSTALLETTVSLLHVASVDPTGPCSQEHDDGGNAGGGGRRGRGDGGEGGEGQDSVGRRHMKHRVLKPRLVVLVEIDNELFQVFFLRPLSFPIEVRDPVFKTLEFADKSGDPTGHVDAQQLAPGRHTISLRLVHPDSVCIILGQNSNGSQSTPTFEWELGGAHLMGIESEPREIYMLQSS